jgi:hypothetical protein
MAPPLIARSTGLRPQALRRTRPVINTMIGLIMNMAERLLFREIIIFKDYSSVVVVLFFVVVLFIRPLGSRLLSDVTLCLRRPRLSIETFVFVLFVVVVPFESVKDSLLSYEPGARSIEWRSVAQPASVRLVVVITASNQMGRVIEKFIFCVMEHSFF